MEPNEAGICGKNYFALVFKKNNKYFLDRGIAV